MTAQTLTDMNHNDVNWQIIRLQKQAKLAKLVKFVVNKRSA